MDDPTFAKGMIHALAWLSVYLLLMSCTLAFIAGKERDEEGGGE